MCKVLRYRYACMHTIRYYASRCGGYRTRPTKTIRNEDESTIRVACCAEPYATIGLQGDCSQCIQEKWTTQQEARISRAESFKNKLLAGKDDPSAFDISIYTHITKFVTDLRDGFHEKLWERRSQYPPMREADSISRQQSQPRAAPAADEVVGLSGANDLLKHGCRKPSMLKHQMRPEDIRDPLPSDRPSTDDQGWIIFECDGEEEDYERSTDPFHPIVIAYDDVPLYTPELEENNNRDVEHDKEGDDGGGFAMCPELMMYYAYNEHPDGGEETPSSSNSEQVFLGRDDHAKSGVHPHHASQGNDLKTRMDKVVDEFWSTVDSPEESVEPPNDSPLEQFFTPRLSKYDRYRLANAVWYKRPRPKRYYANELLIARLELKSKMGVRASSIGRLKDDVELDEMTFLG